MSEMDSDQFFLKWNNFESNLASGFADLLQREAMVDVTLAAEGKIVQAHKIILSICSSYFRNMFQVNPCQHPIVVLKDVRYQELTDMLDFMYKGEANVRQEDLPSFLKLAETLKVKGLVGNQGELDECSGEKYYESSISKLTKNSSSLVRVEPSHEFLDKDSIMTKKKSKRCTSPFLSTESKSQPHSPGIQLEMEEYGNNFLRKNFNNTGQFAAVKEDRLSENSLDSYGDNNIAHVTLQIDKNAGPSSLDETSDALPQEFIFHFNPKRVPIWDFYIVNYDCDMAICKVCRKIIKTRRRDGTRNVLSHMRNLHPSEYALALQFKERWKCMKQKQCFDLYKKKLTQTLRGIRDYSFVESCFGGHLLILGGFSYRRKSITSEKSYWFCCRVKCPAKGILNADGKFHITNFDHNHEPDFENIKRKEKLVKLKKLALQVNSSGQELLEALEIKDDVKKNLNFIRTCRRRDRKRNRHAIPIQPPLNAGLNYKRLPSRISSKEMLLYSGKFFRQDSVNPHNEKCKYWRCRVKKCKSRVKTDDMGNLIILNPLHNHGSANIEETTQSVKTESSSLQNSLSGQTDQTDLDKRSIKRNELIKFSLKIRKKMEKQKQEKFETNKDLNSIEKANLALCPSISGSENFSFEKLVAETLTENYYVANRLTESLNVTKND